MWQLVTHISFALGLHPQNPPGPGVASRVGQVSKGTGWELGVPEQRVNFALHSHTNCFSSFVNTGLVVQYTNDNGITWSLLRELDFMSYLEPQVVSIDLPREAKTPATAFRWWQPQHGEQDRPKNALHSFTQPTWQCYSV